MYGQVSVRDMWSAADEFSSRPDVLGNRTLRLPQYDLYPDYDPRRQNEIESLNADLFRTRDRTPYGIAATQARRAEEDAAIKARTSKFFREREEMARIAILGINL